MEQLAIFGGTPIRKEPLFYGRQYIDDADINAVVNVLRSDYLTCGPKISELEAKLCQITGAKYAVAVSNGTAALHIAAMAAEIGEGDEVITSPITFAASANCTLYCGGKPVFADIDPETYNIDPADMERKITPATKAVVAVDFTGQAVAHKEIEDLCKKHHLIFIEDAAHAIGTKYEGKPIGSLADMTCFSFHPVKTVTSGEGGAVTTNDENLYKKLVLYRSHGITRDMAQMKNPSDNPWYNEQVTLGYNYRLTDIQAALLISQLDKLPAFSKRRSELVDFYNKAFSDLPEIIIQKELPQSDTTRHLYILQLDPDKVTCTRREFFDAMAAEGIHCQVHYLPVYRHSYYEKELGYPKGLCPNAETLYERILSIPLFYKLSDQDAQDVSDAVHKVIAYYRK
ncbi:MAG: UDP-4-amino-4,6-dideoxy-N-acetyl-beta-L-altrosamine transaminase [Lachnospiraceae bacterium]|nr:UDP-4-amino-4,6-dideoxy-N-acetyl-beta-L-altrosamine transaminase [Lachnospiraceae bacterium]